MNSIPSRTKNRKHDNDNSQSEIRPTERLDFLAAVAMDHNIVAKESLAVRAATVILKHRHNQSGNITLKHKTIAAEIGCSVSALKRAVKLLKERWFDVEPVYRDNECIANRYDPRWDEAAAVGGIWSIESEKMTGEVPYCLKYDEHGNVISDDRHVIQNDGVGSITTPPPFSTEPTPVQYRPQVGSVTTQRNSVLETHGCKSSDLISDFHTLDSSRVETLDVPSEERPSGAPADDEHTRARTEYVEDLTEPEFLRILEESLPAYEPFGSFKSQRDKDRGAKHQFKKLIRLGWRRLEILDGVEAYIGEFDHHHDSSSFHGNGACGKTLAGLLAFMVEQSNPEHRNTEDGEMWGDWRIPNRFLIDKSATEPVSSNDNELDDLGIAI